ncbi:MAG: hypothetical protein QM765_23430 [Myxococcales bacterium]
MDGNPLLAWRATTAGLTRIHLARWDGKQWVALGDGLRAAAPGEGSPLDASLRVSRDGSPFFAWTQPEGGLQVARWSGNAWEPLGESVDAGGDSRPFEPSLYLDESGRAWLTWVGGSEAAPRVRVARWSAPAKKWERLHDQATAAGATLGSPVLEAAGSAWLVLAFVEVPDRSIPTTSKLAVARWAGDRFDPAVGPPSTAGGKGPRKLSAISSRDDSLTLAWTELDASRVAKVHAWRLRGGEWSVTLAGLHADPNPANAQDLVLAPVLGGFLALWDEPGGRLERLHVAHVSECAAPQPTPAAQNEGWPRTVDEAAERFLAGLDESERAQLKKARKTELAKLHHAKGSDIRGDFGLFKGNTGLLQSCGGAAEECSMKIVQRAWELGQPAAKGGR